MCNKRDKCCLIRQQFTWNFCKIWCLAVSACSEVVFKAVLLEVIKCNDFQIINAHVKWTEAWLMKVMQWTAYHQHANFPWDSKFITKPRVRTNKAINPKYQNWLPSGREQKRLEFSSDSIVDCRECSQKACIVPKKQTHKKRKPIHCALQKASVLPLFSFPIHKGSSGHSKK